MKKGRTKIFSLDNKDEGNKIVVMGWVRTFRKSKNVSFVSLNDGSTINSLQVVLDMNTIDEKIIDKINNGEVPQPGSYRGRLSSEPENTRKTLIGNKNA